VEIPPSNDEPVLGFAVVVGVLLAMLGFVVLALAVVVGLLLTDVEFRNMVVSS